MAKKPRMGRNLNALLGGSTRERREIADAATNDAAEAAPGTTNEAANEDGLGSAMDAVSAVPAVVTAESAGAPHLASPSAASIIPDNTGSASEDTESRLPGDTLRLLGVDQIRRGTYQPRRYFDPELLQELADSLKSQGMIQPILVRPFAGAYELIAGERRWRAAQLAGLSEIPAIVRDLDDPSVAVVSLIENIQRADLNPLEEAQALQRLCQEFDMTHQAVADSVGRSRVAVSNLMRLLDLHDEVKLLVDRGEVDMGHARALLGAPLAEQPEIARRIVKQRMTVRAVENLVRDLKAGHTPKASTHISDPDIEALRRRLGEILGAPVKVRHQRSGAGKLEISYTSVSELQGILQHIK